MEEIILLVKDCYQIIFKIMVIGYKAQGESIVFELIDSNNDRILYMGCVDSYELGGLNITSDYLQSKADRKLDFLCWSHPDNDHSKGFLNLINDCCNENTLICIPATLDEKLNQKLDLSDANRKIFDVLEAHNHAHPGRLHPVSVSKIDLVDEISIRDETHHTVPFRIWAIAPNGGLVRDWRASSRDTVKNILSVGLTIQLGNYKFIFGGDMPDESIGYVYRTYIKDPLWLKIPHHGSDTSKTMADSISYESRNLYANTTVYTTHHLPHNHVLDYYMQKGCNRIDSTSSGTEDYGIIEYDFDLFRSQTLRIAHKGNAQQIR